MYYLGTTGFSVHFFTNLYRVDYIPISLSNKQHSENQQAQFIGNFSKKCDHGFVKIPNCCTDINPVSVKPCRSHELRLCCWPFSVECTILIDELLLHNGMFSIDDNPNYESLLIRNPDNNLLHNLFRKGFFLLFHRCCTETNLFIGCADSNSQ